MTKKTMKKEIYEKFVSYAVMGALMLSSKNSSVLHGRLNVGESGKLEFLFLMPNDSNFARQLRSRL